MTNNKIDRLGAASTREPQPCQTCSGYGRIMKSESRDLGNGLSAGSAWNEPCPDCHPPAAVRGRQEPQPDKSQEHDAAMALFDARPQMGRERFDGLTLSQRVVRLFEIRDVVGKICTALAGDESAASGEAILPPQPAEPSGVSPRLLALARAQAKQDHNASIYDFVFEGNSADGHDGPFTTCPHPDCALVRAALASSRGTPQRPKGDARVIHSSEIAGDPAAFEGDYVPLEDLASAPAGPQAPQEQ
jgi:hypothetical protein